MDIALDLVEIYLRTNGYLTLSEWQVQTFSDHQRWKTLADIDIFALRLPGPTSASVVAPANPLLWDKWPTSGRHERRV